MKMHIRIDRSLWTLIHNDLSRPHAHAAERVGFVTCRSTALRTGTCLLAAEYFPVADDDYEESHVVGAMIGAGAIRKALQIAYKDPVSMFHVHRHEHRGPPRYSKVDLIESQKLVPNFWHVRPGVPHGTLLLSIDRARGLWWDPSDRVPKPIDEINVVGRPLDTYSHVHA